MAAARGRLLVVGTPIGNLGDLSPRAAEALRSSDLVVAEDTRLAARLLRHAGAHTPTLAFHEHNAEARLPALLARLAAGETLALTTDAGMPGVSDPGARLVAAARAAGAAVEVVPGPSAVTAAMALAGENSIGFLFGGFLPSRPAAVRAAALDRLLAGAAATGLPLILFEAPHRVVTLLGALQDRRRNHPALRVAVGRELTKLHEETLVGSPAEVAAALAPRGEFTLLIAGLTGPGATDLTPQAAALAAAAHRANLPDRTIVELLRAIGMGRRQAYATARSVTAAGATGKRALRPP